MQVASGVDRPWVIDQNMSARGFYERHGWRHGCSSKIRPEAPRELLYTRNGWTDPSQEISSASGRTGARPLARLSS